MKKITAMYLILWGAILSGCGTEPKREVLSDVVLAPPTKSVSIPKQLMVKCPLIAKLDEREYTKKELLAVAKNAIAQYDECRSNDAILIDTIRKAFNVIEK